MMPRLDPHKLVALYEGGKAVCMVVIGLGCLSLVHRDVHEIAVRWLEQMRCNPAGGPDAVRSVWVHKR